MREEVKRILVMVQDGTISAEDAAELIEAFEEPQEAAAEPTTTASASTSAGSASYTTESTSYSAANGGSSTSGTAGKDPFRAFVETMEKFGREAAQSVDWPEVTKQVKTSAQQGIEALKTGLESVTKGKGFIIFGSTEMKEISLPLSVPVDKLLRIENHAGAVKVVGGFDVGSVTARAHVRGATEEEVKRHLEEFTLLLEESESAVIVKQPDIPNVIVDLEVQLSSSSTVEIRAESSDISILDSKGGCKIQSRSGDIKLRGLNGPIDVNLTSGNVSIEDSIAPNITVENKSGNLLLRRVAGMVGLRTTSGNISLEEVNAKTVSAETVSGNVNATLTSDSLGTLNIRTVSGNSMVTLPEGAGLSDLAKHPSRGNRV